MWEIQMSMTLLVLLTGQMKTEVQDERNKKK